MKRKEELNLLFYQGKNIMVRKRMLWLSIPKTSEMLTKHEEKIQGQISTEDNKTSICVNVVTPLN
jgi:hypothetical protein